MKNDPIFMFDGKQYITVDATDQVAIWERNNATVNYDVHQAIDKDKDIQKVEQKAQEGVNKAAKEDGQIEN